MEQFKRNTSIFPLCSKDFILKQLDTEDTIEQGDSFADTFIKQKKPFKLYLAPPVNSHVIKSSPVRASDVEYFLHSDNTKIIRVSLRASKMNVQLCNQNGIVYNEKSVDTQN